MKEQDTIKQKTISPLSLPWPPTYTIKRHAQIRHCKFTFLPTGVLSIRIPTRFNHRLIPTLLEENKNFIQQHYLLFIQKMTADCLPTDIDLTAIQQQWKIHYMYDQNKDVFIKKIDITQHTLSLSGNIHDKMQCKKILRSWIRKQAKSYLIPWLDRLNQNNVFHYQRVHIRSQRSRWGSYSATGTISLNDKLLFLPPHLVTHVLIHELCHTLYLNHSSDFWKLFSTLDPQYQVNKKALVRISKTLPTWLD